MNPSVPLVASDAYEPVVPAVFGRALTAVRGATIRPELQLGEIPAPGGLAPHAIAMAADVIPVKHGLDSVLGTGRFVLLYDPEEPEAWGGAFRVVCFAQAPLETDIGLDPFVAEVAWSTVIRLRSRLRPHSASGPSVIERPKKGSSTSQGSRRTSPSRVATVTAESVSPSRLATFRARS